MGTFVHYCNTFWAQSRVTSYSQSFLATLGLSLFPKFAKDGQKVESIGPSSHLQRGHVTPPTSPGVSLG